MKAATYLKVLLLPVVVVMLTTPLAAQEIEITAQSDEARAKFIEARTLFENIRFDEARELLGQVLEKDPELAQAYIYRALGSNSDAEFNEYLKKAEGLKDKVSDGERMMIESLRASSDNNQQEAIRISEDLVTAYPEDKRAHQWLAFNYLGSDMDDKALDHFNKAIELDSEFAPPYNNVGYIYREKGDYAKAEEAFQTYISLLPEEANPHDSIADLYTKMGEHEKAIEHYNKALDLNPSFFFSQQKIGDNLVFMGDFEGGREAYDKALAMDIEPTAKVFIKQGIANSYLYEDQVDKAIAAMEEATNMAREQNIPEMEAKLLNTIGLIYLENGNVDRAAENLSKCQKVAENATLTASARHGVEKSNLMGKAYLAAKKGDFTSAMDQAESIKQLSNEAEDQKDYHAMVGLINFEKGDYATAIEHLNQADMKNPYTLYYMARSYEQNGDEEKARKYYEKAANWNEDSTLYALVRSKAMNISQPESVYR